MLKYLFVAVTALSIAWAENPKVKDTSKTACSVKDNPDLKIIPTVFSTKTYALKNIADVHRQEWLDSAINEDLIDLNLTTVPDVVCQKSKSLKTGIEHYPVVELLGFKAAGVDYKPTFGRIAWTAPGLAPPDFREEKVWGELKITPTGSRPNQKYEVPIQESNQALSQQPYTNFLKVPQKLSELIFIRYGDPIAKSKNFWQRVVSTEIPIQIAEGTKKAAAILSAGYVGIGLRGACGGIRTLDAEDKILVPPELVREIQLLVKKDRIFYIVFDNDSAAITHDFVDSSTTTFGEALVKAGASVKVIELPGPEKGVDDFILARGVEAYSKLVVEAVNFADWSSKHPAKFPLQELARYRACRNY